MNHFARGGVDYGEGGGGSTGCRDPKQAAGVERIDDQTVLIPRAAAALVNVAEGEYIPAGHFDFQQFAPGEKGDPTAVRRPERIGPLGGAGQRPERRSASISRSQSPVFPSMVAAKATKRPSGEIIGMFAGPPSCAFCGVGRNTFISPVGMPGLSRRDSKA